MLACVHLSWYRCWENKSGRCHLIRNELVKCTYFSFFNGCQASDKKFWFFGMLYSKINTLKNINGIFKKNDESGRDILGSKCVAKSRA